MKSEPPSYRGQALKLLPWICARCARAEDEQRLAGHYARATTQAIASVVSLLEIGPTASRASYLAVLSWLVRSFAGAAAAARRRRAVKS